MWVRCLLPCSIEALGGAVWSLHPVGPPGTEKGGVLGSSEGSRAGRQARLWARRVPCSPHSTSSLAAAGAETGAASVRRGSRDSAALRGTTCDIQAVLGAPGPPQSLCCQQSGIPETSRAFPVSVGQELRGALGRTLSLATPGGGELAAGPSLGPGSELCRRPVPGQVSTGLSHQLWGPLERRCPESIWHSTPPCRQSGCTPGGVLGPSLQGQREARGAVNPRGPWPGFPMPSCLQATCACAGWEHSGRQHSQGPRGGWFLRQPCGAGELRPAQR